MRRAETKRFRAAVVAVALSIAGCGGGGGDGGGSAPDTVAPDTVATDTTAPVTTGSTTTVPSTVGSTEPTTQPVAVPVRTGADVLVADGLGELRGQRVGLIVHQTSVVDGVHLIDWVADAADVELAAIFAPEHGLRGVADAGELVADSVDADTGVPVHSLYGSTRAPTAEMLAGIDTLVFDLQDVGTRFYTYTATMGLAMQAAAEHGVRFVVLDRPNPIGGERVEGFARTPDHVSFVSQYPTPATHGLTGGELATMIVGETWLPGLDGLDLSVVDLHGWSRAHLWDDTGRDWRPPSPGLPSSTSALVYPGTVLVEATDLSYGRGTLTPFTMVGAPWADAEALAAELDARALPGVRFEATTFVPADIPDMATDPPFEGVEVHGVEIVPTDPSSFEPVRTGLHVLEVFQAASLAAGEGSIVDRAAMFDLLAGTTELRLGLEAGTPADDLVAAWQADVAAFEALRAPYLRY